MVYVTVTYFFGDTSFVFNINESVYLLTSRRKNAICKFDELSLLGVKPIQLVGGWVGGGNLLLSC